MSYVAFDLGGSGGKIFLGEYENGMLTLNEVHRFTNDVVSLNNHLHWDMCKIYSELICGLKKAMSESKTKILSLGIDSFCNDFALVDNNGEVVSPVRSYRDDRTERYKDEIYELVSPETLYSKNGNQIAPFNTFMQLAAMVVAGQKYMLDGAYKMLFVPDLLIYFLTDNMKCEYTNASVSQLYNFKENDFDAELLAVLGIKRELFADIAMPGDFAGNITEDIFPGTNAHEIKVVNVCQHDTASAFISAMENSIIISSGTWSLVGVKENKPIINSSAYVNNIANEGSFEDEFRIIKNVMGFWVAEQTKKQCEAEHWSHSQVVQMCKEATPYKYLIDIDEKSLFYPENMISKIQEMCKEGYSDSPKSTAEIFRCIYDSIVMKYRYCTELIESLVNKKYEYINIIGGGCKNELVCQLTADVTGKTVFAGPSEATAIGNIAVQMKANNDISNLCEVSGIVKNSENIKVYYPTQENKDELQRVYDFYKSNILHNS